MKINIYNAAIILVLMSLSLACESNSLKNQSTLAAKSKKLDESVKFPQVGFSNSQYDLAEIKLGKIEMRNLSNLLKLNGEVEIEPSGVATLSAPLGGYLLTSALLPGEKVKKGQVLAVLEDPKFIEIQQRYLEGLSQMEYLHEEFLRQKKLRDLDVNSAKTFQKVSSDYKTLQAKIKGLEETLRLIGVNISSLKDGNLSRKANVYSPIDGFIKTSNYNLGNYVNPKDVLFEIVNTNELHLLLNAYENDISQLEEGQEIRFSSGSEYGYKRKAQIFLLGKTSSKERLIPVHCHINDKDVKGIMPGMYVKALVETSPSKQKSIPSEAIVKYKGNDCLIRMISKSENNYLFEFVPISKGISTDGYTAVEIPGMESTENIDWVIKNAYSIVSAKINSEEE